MRPSSSILSLAVPLLASAAPTLIRRANDADVTVLQFAGVLEDLESQFYSQALSKFQASDFTAAGFTDPNIPIQQFTVIGGDESTHLTFLQDTLKTSGASAVAGCKFDFSSALTDVATMAPIARTVENVGVAAYLGAASLITDPTILTAAASILTVEARHQTVLNLVNNATSIPQAFDIPLTPNEVLAIAGGFISGCDTGIKANTALTVTNTGSIAPGTKLTFSSSALNGNQANIAARHYKSVDDSKNSDSSSKSMSSGSTDSSNSTSTSTSTSAAESATSSSNSKSSKSSKDKNSGSDKSSKSSKDKDKSKNKNKNSSSDNNNNNSNNNSTSSSNSTCSANSQLFCQILVGGAATSMSLAIDDCQIPDGLNGPAAVFITCDENTLPNDVVQRASDTGSVLAGPAMIFIDSESDILAGLSKTGASCEGSNSTSSDNSSSSYSSSDSSSSSTTMESSSTTTMDSSSTSMTETAVATSTSMSDSSSSAAMAESTAAVTSTSMVDSTVAAATSTEAAASATDTAATGAASSGVLTTTINSSMAMSIISAAATASASAGSGAAIGNIVYGSVPAAP